MPIATTKEFLIENLENGRVKHRNNSKSIVSYTALNASTIKLEQNRYPRHFFFKNSQLQAQVPQERVPQEYFMH